MGAAEYSLHGNELRISGSLDSPLDIRFDIGMRALVEGAKQRGVKDMVVDLRDITSIASQFVGALAAVAGEAENLGGTLTVRVQGRVAQVLCQSGLDKLVALQVE